LSKVRNFLGRAPKDQVAYILATQGIRGFVSAMVNSMEYLQVFGEYSSVLYLAVPQQ